MIGTDGAGTILASNAHRSRARWVCVVVAVVASASCTQDGPTSDAERSSSGSVPVVTPSAAYHELPYTNDAQRRTFRAYLSCARDHGVDFDGPFTDSAGHSIFFKLAPGATATKAQQEKVQSECPQGTVGLVGTPIDRVNGRLFERAVSEFASCMRSHGVSSFAVPSFGHGDPVRLFWRLPFDWSSDRFTAAANACIDPLRSYLFAAA